MRFYKLTDDQVRTIKSRLASADPPSLAQLGRDFGVNPVTIRRIRDGKLRANVR